MVQLRTVQRLLQQVKPPEIQAEVTKASAQPYFRWLDNSANEMIPNAAISFMTRPRYIIGYNRILARLYSPVLFRAVLAHEIGHAVAIETGADSCSLWGHAKLEMWCDKWAMRRLAELHYNPEAVPDHYQFTWRHALLHASQSSIDGIRTGGTTHPPALERIEELNAYAKTLRWKK